MLGIPTKIRWLYFLGSTGQHIDTMGGQIISVTDPDTGEIIQKVIQNTIDPKTGKTVQVTLPLNSIQNGSKIYSSDISLLYIFPQNTQIHLGGEGQIITVPDPVTGELVQQMLQTVIDPVTGQTNQVMIPINFSGSK